MFFTWYFIALFSLFIITELVIIISRALSIIQSFGFDLSQKEPEGGSFLQARERWLPGRSQRAAGLVVLLRPAAGRDCFCSGGRCFSGAGGGRQPAEVWFNSAGNLCQHPAVCAGV